VNAVGCEKSLASARMNELSEGLALAFGISFFGVAAGFDCGDELLFITTGACGACIAICFDASMSLFC